MTDPLATTIEDMTFMDMLRNLSEIGLPAISFNGNKRITLGTTDALNLVTIERDDFVGYTIPELEEEAAAQIERIVKKSDAATRWHTDYEEAQDHEE